MCDFDSPVFSGAVIDCGHIFELVTHWQPIQGVPMWTAEVCTSNRAMVCNSTVCTVNSAEPVQNINRE